MSELQPAAPPPRGELLRALAARIGSLVPGGRLLARELLGAGSRIDLVAADASGRVVLVLLAEAGRELETVARAVAQQAWVQARLGDWLALAPQLGVRPEAAVGVRLLAPGFGEEARAAARALPELELLPYQCVRGPGGVDVLVSASQPEPEAARAVPQPLRPARRDPAAPPAFRTGLSDADLDLAPEERAEFDSAS